MIILRLLFPQVFLVKEQRGGTLVLGGVLSLTIWALLSALVAFLIFLAIFIFVMAFLVFLSVDRSAFVYIVTQYLLNDLVGIVLSICLGVTSFAESVLTAYLFVSILLVSLRFVGLLQKKPKKKYDPNQIYENVPPKASCDSQ